MGPVFALYRELGLNVGDVAAPQSMTTTIPDPMTDPMTDQTTDRMTDHFAAPPTSSASVPAFLEGF